MAHLTPMVQELSTPSALLPLGLKLDEVVNRSFLPCEVGKSLSVSLPIADIDFYVCICICVY
jgi:hypothetical protein